MQNLYPLKISVVSGLKCILNLTDFLLRVNYKEMWNILLLVGGGLYIHSSGFYFRFGF